MKIIVCADFFLMSNGPQLKRMTPLGPRPHVEWAQIEKKNPIGSLVPCVTGEGLSWGLKAYRENECVFKVKNKDILEKYLKTTLSGKSKRF